jgi:predicted RNA-binding protein (virulence factor B family)
MTSNNLFPHVEYKRGQLIKVKVVSFGPMGASVSIGEDNRRGLILQKELAMFRDRRDREQVVVGEVLDGYVERVRETGNVDVALRPVDVARIEVVKKEVMEALGIVVMVMMKMMMMMMMMALMVVVMMMMMVTILIFQSIVSP